MARHGGQPLGAGDIVTTGTLTPALPAASGQHWRAQVDTLPLPEIAVRLS
jgi:2-oxo-3-hexenedioate decarboxylase